MLVLTRKAGEGILIGDDIRIKVLEEKDGKVRLGVEAPEDKKIYREEVYERICQENKAASSWDPEKLDAVQAVLKKSREKE